MVIGVDYSMTCPAAVAWSDTPQFWCAQQRTHPTLPHLTTYVITSTEMMVRAHAVAHALLTWMQTFPVTRVVLEDYAYAATGRVFHIGEHTGILKSILWQHQYTVSAVPPTVVKKFATGKGNADKPRMTAAFVEAYPAATAWIPHFFPRSTAAAPAKSPLADLADAYWIAKYAASQH